MAPAGRGVSGLTPQALGSPRAGHGSEDDVDSWWLVGSSLLDAAVQWMSQGLQISNLKIFERNPARFEILKSVMEHDPTEAQRARRGGPPSDARPTPTFDVFLSFSSSNADAADTFNAELEKQRPGTTVFDYRIAIDPGRSYQTAIDRAMASCKVVVAILSPPYRASPECQEELP